MNPRVEYCLFRYAPRELSHSAFWAWALKNSAPVEEADEEAGRLGRALLTRLDLPLPEEQMKVETEVPLPDNLGRVDILVRIDRSHELVVENKTSALLQLDQLERYRRMQQDRSVRFAAISTSFDPEFEPREAQEWEYLGEEDLLRVVEEADSPNPLIVDYQTWLTNLVHGRQAIREAALSERESQRKEALHDEVGQWAFLERLLAEIDDESNEYRIYRGYNRGGRPWTELGFTADRGACDALFYRIDVAVFGPYLALRQYQETPYPSVEAKKARLAVLRQLWGEAVDEVECTPLIFERPRNRGTKECEIALLDLGKNRPSSILAELPKVHRRFVNALRENGLIAD